MSGDGKIFGLDRKKALVGVVVAVALSAGAVAMIGQVTSYGQLAEALRRANKFWFPVTLAGEAAAFLGYLVAYRSVAAADGGPRLRLRDTARVIALGLGAYVIGSAAGGLGVDYWAMRQAGEKTHEAAKRTLALNTLQAGALFSLAAIAGCVLLAQGASHVAAVMAAVWVGVVPAAIAGAAVVSSDWLAPRLTDAPEGERRPRHFHHPRRWLAWVGAKLRKLGADTIGGLVVARDVVSRPVHYLGGLAGYPLFWLGDFFILWVALAAFGTQLAPQRLVVAEATAWALTLVPLPGGGSGFSEAAMSYTLHAVGVPLSHAIFAALTYRAVNFWLPVIPALALLPSVDSLSESLSHSPRSRSRSKTASRS